MSDSPYSITAVTRAAPGGSKMADITGRDKVWLATGSQIADWYRGENKTVDDHVARIKSEAEAADPLGAKL